MWNLFSLKTFFVQLFEVSKAVQRLLSTKAKDPSWTTTSKHQGRNIIDFFSVHRKSLSLLRPVLLTSQKTSDGYGLHVAFSQKSGNFETDGFWDPWSRWNAWSFKPCPGGPFSSFLSAFSCCFCAESLVAPIIRTFTWYIRIVQFQKQRNAGCGSTDKDLKNLEKSITCFKIYTKTVLKKVPVTSVLH